MANVGVPGSNEEEGEEERLYAVGDVDVGEAEVVFEPRTGSSGGFV